jgi:hypothetical protein
MRVQLAAHTITSSDATTCTSTQIVRYLMHVHTIQAFFGIIQSRYDAHSRLRQPSMLHAQLGTSWQMITTHQSACMEGVKQQNLGAINKQVRQACMRAGGYAGKCRLSSSQGETAYNEHAWKERNAGALDGLSQQMFCFDQQLRVATTSALPSHCCSPEASHMLA